MVAREWMLPEMPPYIAAGVSDTPRRPAPPAVRREVTSVGSHRLRVRYCSGCQNGDHDLDCDSWRTDFLSLVRKHCACEDCDCAFERVFIEDLSFDRRHHQPVRGRKRQIGGRRAA